ncbi:hypothetical protein D9M71_777950 [compost metagenome]
MAKLLPSKPAILKLKKLILVILESGSLMVHSKPTTEISAMIDKSNLENGFLVASSGVSVSSTSSVGSGFKPIFPKMFFVK